MFSDGAADNKTIKVCKSYLESIWGAPLNESTTKFDGCGFYTYWRDQPKAVLPSLVFLSCYKISLLEK